MAKRLIAYQQEPDEIAAVAWERTPAHLTPLELFRIAAWKSAKGLGSLTLNTEGEIVARSTAAMEAIAPLRGHPMVGVTGDDAWDAWRETSRNAIGSAKTRSGLLGLHGVGYPMATAILAILDPDVWPVIDKWAVKAVFGKVDRSTDWQRAVAYEAYARHLATIGAKCWSGRLSIHALDQKAMHVGMKSERAPAEWRRATIPD